mmetsp:Transcript_4120/g.7148  ORF Transcript_4120/g.7148 Transcript_4120/m.7148 type:complete len:210 (-) Transcript_4120:182-811(-)
MADAFQTNAGTVTVSGFGRGQQRVDAIQALKEGVYGKMNLVQQTKASVRRSKNYIKQQIAGTSGKALAKALSKTTSKLVENGMTDADALALEQVLDELSSTSCPAITLVVQNTRPMVADKAAAMRIELQTVQRDHKENARMVNDQICSIQAELRVQRLRVDSTAESVAVLEGQMSAMMSVLKAVFGLSQEQPLTIEDIQAKIAPLALTN